MEAKKTDRSFPIEMLPCKACGEMPRLHFGRKDGKWYLDCPSICWQTPRSASKLLICQKWNLENRKDEK